MHNINYRIKLHERFRCNVINLLLVTGIFIFHFACDWRVNVTGFFMFQFAYSYFYVSPSLHGCLLYSTNLKNYPQIYTKKKKDFYMHMWIIFEIGRLKETSM